MGRGGEKAISDFLSKDKSCALRVKIAPRLLVSSQVRIVSPPSGAREGHEPDLCPLSSDISRTAQSEPSLPAVEGDGCPCEALLPQKAGEERRGEAHPT